MLTTISIQLRWGRGLVLAALGVLSWLGKLSAEPATAIIPPFSQRVWTQADGLPSNDVFGLSQDATGYLWIATATDLARFDGTRFVRYDLSGDGQPRGPGVAAVAAERTGDGVWVAPLTGGLLRFAEGRLVPHPLPGDYAEMRIARLFVAGDEALWICFEGGDVMRMHGTSHEVFDGSDGLERKRSTQIASDGAGRVWLASGSQLFRYESGQLRRIAFEVIRENVRIAPARQDGPWVLVRGWLRKVVDDQLPVKIKVNAGFNAYSVPALLEDARGGIWTSTRSRGVRRLSLPDDSNLIFDAPDDIGVLFEDRAGNIWAGANGGGLVRVRASLVSLFDKRVGLLDPHVLSVCQDRTGTIWVADRDGGVAYLNEQGRFMSLAAPPSLRATMVVRSVVPAEGEGVWAATSQGLWRATRQGLVRDEAVTTPSGHGNLRVTYRSRNGDYWVALEPSRLGRLRAGVWREFGPKEGIGAGVIQAIAEDADGHVWIGTEEGQLFREQDERFVEVPLADGRTTGGVQAIHFDAQGAGWIGTARSGLHMLGAPSGRALTEAAGLPTQNITQVISDDFGQLWFGSPEGIFRVRREELTAWFAGRARRVDAALVGIDDGVREAPCASNHHPSVWKSRDGLVWFATRQGVVAIDPQREVPQAPTLIARTDTVRADGAVQPAIGPVRIPPLAHTVELGYSVLCLSTPDRVRARVRLRGYDAEWLPAEERGVARYTRLPPGRYVFEISARLAGVPRSGIRVAVPITVEAAWWQEPAVRIGGVLLLVTGAVVAVRSWSHRRLRKRLAELERASALERERARIAQNIHDDLGSGLTRISLLTQAAESGNDRAQLDRIYRTVSDLTQSMDEIVWAVNPKNDNLEGFANYLVEFAQGFLTDAGMRCRVLLPEVLPARSLPAQVRHHLFLGCKEALNNVAKHARATEVTVRMQVEGERLLLSVVDNGRGFDPQGPAIAPRPGGQNGLANLRARLAALGGTCEISSSSGGTTVLFSAPLLSDPDSP